MKQHTKYHNCKLPGESSDILTKFIEGGIFVTWRRRIKRFTLINHKHPSTLGYAKSLARLKEDERVHLVEHFHMIHPFSMFSLYFNMFCAINLLFSYIRAPVMYPLLHKGRETVKAGIPMNLFYVIMMLFNFCTGYFDESQNTVIMDRWKVAKHYLKTYFLWDILTFTPLILALNFDIYTVVNPFYMTWLRTIMTFVKYARYYWCIGVMKTTRRYYGINTIKFQITITVFSLLNFLLLFNNLLLYAEATSFHNNLIEFLQHTEHTLKLLMLVSYGKLRTATTDEQLVHCVFIVCGFIVHLRLLITTMAIWNRYFCTQNQQTLVYDSIGAYMRYKALPQNLRRKIYLYLEFKYQGDFYKENVIQRATSNNLKREMILAGTKMTVERVGFLKMLPQAILERIRTVYISQIFLPGDYIISAGTLAQAMFILVSGTAVVTSPNNTVLLYLRDGTHFGEIALVFPLTRAANIIAITPCEVFRLNRDKFLRILAKFPQSFENLQTFVLTRLGQPSNTGAVSVDMVLFPKPYAS